MSSTVLLVPPVLLAVVLLVSAVAKLRDPRDTRSVFRQLGVPQVLVRLRAPRLLPYAELVLAAGLLLAPGRWYVVAAFCSLGLFSLYVVVIQRALKLPYPVTCPCFGRLGLGEVTRRTLVRNVVLLVLAILTWADSWRGRGPHAWVVTGILLLAAGVALGLGALVRLVVRRDRHAYRPRPMPDGVLHGPSGPVSLSSLTDAAARLLVFCDSSRDSEVVECSRGWSAELAPAVVVHVVSETTGVAAGDAPLRDPDGVVRRALRVASPGAVLLGTNRMVVGGPVTGAEAISDLVDAAAHELAAG